MNNLLELNFASTIWQIIGYKKKKNLNKVLKKIFKKNYIIM